MESQKNAHRLNRIFRKPKAMVSARSWRGESDDPEQAQPYSGVLLGAVSAMVANLSDEDRRRAIAEQDPPSVVQEELMRRAARFGLPVAAIGGTDGSGSSVAVTPEMAAAMQRRVERFGTSVPSSAAEVLKLSEADREAMIRRQNRFGS
ncbi:hypothetical protein ERJ75_000881600 [Trypanosoma vivax]|nr:hypothetical protein TRVL_02454 [Trypanosoma vivax]KAH8612528.1 hypothetical protein ERJ75_000881600 [Trypanosoma vivax]